MKSASSILKQQVEKNRIAIQKMDSYLKRLNKNLKDNSIDTTDGISSGAQRLSWYTSCFFESYRDVCQDQMNEDVRFYLAVKEIVKNNDIVLYMVQLYLEYSLSLFSEEKSDKIIITLIKKINNQTAEENIIKNLKIILGVSSQIAATKATIKSISYAIAYSSSRISNLRPAALLRFYKINNLFMAFLSAYGKINELSLKAQWLKYHNPSFYWLLYRYNVEMLYYFIDPIISQAVAFIKSNSDIDDIVSDLYNIAVNMADVLER